MNHYDQAALLARHDSLAVPGRHRAASGFAAPGEQPADAETGLVSLAYIRAAVRRGARLWCCLAVAGLVTGLAADAAYPPAYQAATSVLLTLGPSENVNSAPLDNQAIAESRAVAGLATRMLGLRQDPGSLLAGYTVTVLSPRVLRITVSAPSSSDAVRRANAVAAAFLRLRARQLEADQNLVLRSLGGQLSQARQRARTISSQLRQLPAQPASAAQQAQLARLQQQQSQVAATVATLQQDASAARASSATTLAVKGSQVLDTATPILHSKLKRLLPRPAIGLVLGLALGLGLVVIRALASDKLCRRDDVAQALGVPVRFSAGEVRLRGWSRRRRGLAAAGDANVRKVVAHLRGLLPVSGRDPAALAVVPVGEPDAAALSVVSLALSCAREGQRVVLADLAPGAPAACLLAAGEPGARPVRLADAQLTVAVPGDDEAGAAVPFRHPPAGTGESSFTGAVGAARGSADLLLTLAVLDPSLGSDQFPEWAGAAVVVVTAGQSSWTQIHATGQLLRLAGAPVVSAVLVGSDASDESLGCTVSPGAVPATPGPGLTGR